MSVISGKASGTRNAAVLESIEKGNAAHAILQERMRAKGWLVDRVDTGIVDPSTGRKVYPDALTPTGHPVEVKPKTESGIEKGETQLKLYEWITGRKGRVNLL